MIFIPQLISFLSWRRTATDDQVFSITNEPVWLKYADVLCFTAPGTICDAVGSVVAHVQRSDNAQTIMFEIPHPVRACDIFIKNRDAGQNTTAVLMGTPLTKNEKEDLGVFD